MADHILSFKNNCIFGTEISEIENKAYLPEGGEDGLEAGASTVQEKGA